MPDIYDQHRKAFEHVSAYVVMRGDDRVATVAFKFSKSGLRVTCYLHILGAEMVRAYASGGGYDRQSAAVHSAIGRVRLGDANVRTSDITIKIREAVKDDGTTWDATLRQAGFVVVQAV